MLVLVTAGGRRDFVSSSSIFRRPRVRKSPSPSPTALPPTRLRKVDADEAGLEFDPELLPPSKPARRRRSAIRILRFRSSSSSTPNPALPKTVDAIFCIFDHDPVHLFLSPSLVFGLFPIPQVFELGFAFPFLGICDVGNAAVDLGLICNCCLVAVAVIVAMSVSVSLALWFADSDLVLGGAKLILIQLKPPHSAGLNRHPHAPGLA